MSTAPAHDHRTHDAQLGLDLPDWLFDAPATAPAPSATAEVDEALAAPCGDLGRPRATLLKALGALALAGAAASALFWPSAPSAAGEPDFTGDFPELISDDPPATPVEVPASPGAAPAASVTPAPPAKVLPRHRLPAPTTPTLERAATAVQQGAFVRASTLYLRALRAEPKNPDAWYGLALCRFELGQRRLAVAAGQRALKLAPRHPEAAMLMGFIAQESKAFDTARGLYEVSLAASPEGPWATELKSVLANLAAASPASARP